jgi:hypothetical protein
MVNGQAAMNDSRRAKRTAPRPFGLLDMMVLVLAFGPVFLVLRDRYDYYRTPSSQSVHRTVEALLAVINAILMGLTLALTVFVLRGPRPGLRHVLRRPGPAACVAACAAIVVMTARMWVKSYVMYALANRGGSFQARYVYHWLVGDQVRIGFAVLGAWVALLMTRGWRPEPSWLDSAGRVLGWGWLSLALFHVLLPWIKPFLPAI